MKWSIVIILILFLGPTLPAMAQTETPDCDGFFCPPTLAPTDTPTPTPTTGSGQGPPPTNTPTIAPTALDFPTLSPMPTLTPLAVPALTPLSPNPQPFITVTPLATVTRRIITTTLNATTQANVREVQTRLALLNNAITETVDTDSIITFADEVEAVAGLPFGFMSWIEQNAPNLYLLIVPNVLTVKVILIFLALLFLIANSATIIDIVVKLKAILWPFSLLLPILLLTAFTPPPPKTNLLPPVPPLPTPLATQEPTGDLIILLDDIDLSFDETGDTGYSLAGMLIMMLADMQGFNVWSLLFYISGSGLLMRTFVNVRKRRMNTYKEVA